jgi:hypothetical protein
LTLKVQSREEKRRERERKREREREREWETIVAPFLLVPLFYVHYPYCRLQGSGRAPNPASQHAGQTAQSGLSAGPTRLNERDMSDRPLNAAWSKSWGEFTNVKQLFTECFDACVNKLLMM